MHPYRNFDFSSIYISPCEDIILCRKDKRIGITLLSIALYHLLS